jgi:pimeloyl-ACP methyl ester carboxylesterase
VADLRLDQQRAGAGEPLVVIHGIGSTWQVWNPILPALEGRHDVLALSLPGYGDSPPLDGDPTVPALGNAVEEAMDAAGLETAHLVGNSLGGWIAAELAGRGRARTVVAISPSGLFTRKELLFADRSLRFAYAAAQQLAPHADRLMASALGRRLAFGQMAVRPERLDPEGAAYALRVFAGSPSFLRTLDWIRDGMEMPRGLDRIRCPVRIAWGTRDLLLPRRQGPRWTRHVQGAELVDLPGLGHVPMSDDPELVARTVLEVTAAGAASSSEPQPAAARA